jgi:SPX domain protein involved in polyphosphate accumulation
MRGVEVTPRLELKYLVDEAQAEAVRRDLEGYCDRDRHCPERPGYRVLTLYFDTATLAFHRAKLRRDHDRIKLRARRYGEADTVFLEVKRKTGDIVTKLRAVVPWDRWRDAARGFLEAESASAPAKANLDAFVHLMAETGAEPRLLVEYYREAFVSTVDRYARVTFDRSIRARAEGHWELPERSSEQGWLDLDHDRTVDHYSPLILELKCERAVPEWMRGLIRRRGLVRTAFSKYSTGIAAARNDLWLDVSE